MSWKRLLIIALLPFLSGAAALSHELLWTRRLIDLMGASDWVIGRVLGLFFLGISLGGYLATLRFFSQRPAISQLAIAEICVAILALPAVFLPAWTDWIWVAIGTESLVSWQGPAVKLLIAGMVVLPPAIAMGFTLPLFVRAATDQGSDVARVGIWIYALNTFGGVFGLWFASTYLIQFLGAQWAMLAVAAVNAVVALFAWAPDWTGKDKPLDRRATRAERKAAKKARQAEQKAQLRADKGADNKQPEQLELASDSSGFSRWQLIGLSFLSGFIVLSLEVLLLRLIALVVPSSYHTTSALLANVILILAVSSGGISLFNSLWRTNSQVTARWIMIIGFVGAAICISLCPAILFERSDKLMSIRYVEGLNGRLIESVNHYWLLIFGLVASTGGLALLFSGMVFPSLMTISSSDDPAGQQIGRLLAANGIGGLIGSELCNSVLISQVGVYGGFLVVALLPLLTAAALLFSTNRLMAVVASIALLIVVYFAHDHSRSIPYLSPRTRTNFEVQATHFGREGVLLVVEKPDNKSRSILVNNQYVLGGSGAVLDQRRQMLLPWLLHPTAKTVCSMGLATGISASGLEGLQDPPAITAVELSANVELLARQYFQRYSGSFFERPANRVVIEDARTYMAAANNQFDLIVGDLYRPHGSGEGRLFSVEHFRNVRRALTEDGLYCQWLPVHQLNRENFVTIAATFQNVFSETLLVYGNQDQRFPILGLVGRKSDRKWQPEELMQNLENVSASVAEQDPFIMQAKGLIVGELKKEKLATVPLNTLDNLLVEHSAGNFWILKDLRRNRVQSSESEFLSGDYLDEFKRYLEELTLPVLPRTN